MARIRTDSFTRSKLLLAVAAIALFACGGEDRSFAERPGATGESAAPAPAPAPPQPMTASIDALVGLFAPRRDGGPMPAQGDRGVGVADAALTGGKKTNPCVRGREAHNDGGDGDCVPRTRRCRYERPFSFEGAIAEVHLESFKGGCVGPGYQLRKVHLWPKGPESVRLIEALQDRLGEPQRRETQFMAELSWRSAKRDRLSLVMHVGRVARGR